MYPCTFYNSVYEVLRNDSAFTQRVVYSPLASDLLASFIKAQIMGPTLNLWN
jgi:hypothetical protein